MKPFPFFRALLLLCPLGLGTSCVHLMPVQREFETAATYTEEGSLSPGELHATPVEPDFTELKMERSLSPALLQPPGGPYRVGPGDTLDIEVAELADTRATTKVMPDGMLYYNVAKGINVKDKSVQEISTQLSALLADDYVSPVVSVNIANADSQRFWMLGQVETPGTYPLTKPTTVIDAISQGGGLLSNRQGIEVSNPEAADLEKAILIRDGKLIPVDFARLITQGDMSQNVYVHPGDYIFVPSLTVRSLYVLGAVNRPGPVYYEPGTSVLAAVAAAGGPKTGAIVTKALIVRGGTRQPKVAVVNIKAITTGKEPDLILQGGDIVWVPQSPWTKLEDYAEGVLLTAAQAIAVQEGLGLLGTVGGTGVTISAQN